MAWLVAVPSAARTANSDSGLTTGWGTSRTLRLQLQVTAASGTTPTLDVVVEDSLDAVNWNAVGTFTQATAVTRQVINITTPYAENLRFRWTVAGTTPSFTFSVIVYSE